MATTSAASLGDMSRVCLSDFSMPTTLLAYARACSSEITSVPIGPAGAPVRANAAPLSFSACARMKASTLSSKSASFCAAASPPAAAAAAFACGARR
jgi:hypothetical protein